MKNSKYISILILFVGILFGCGGDDNFITQEGVKKKINDDLSGKVWTAYRYVEIVKNPTTGASNEVVLNLENSPIKSIKFENMGLAVEGTFSSRLVYDVTSVGYGMTSAPDPHVLTIKDGITSYFVMYLKHDYSSLSADFRLISDNKVYMVYFRK